MKSPRDILFDRHRPAEPKLDRLREDVLANLRDGSAAVGKPNFGPSRSSLARKETSGSVWRNLIVSLRWHLAGLSAAWLIIIILHAGDSPNTTSTFAKQEPFGSPQLATALRENRRQLRELTGAAIADTKTTVPAPHSGLNIRRERSFGELV